MNIRDSEHILAELRAKEGYEIASSAEEADLILINTCSVRERPVSKLFSELGAFNLTKKEGAKIGVCGCTATHLGAAIFRRAPFVDFVLGARNVSRVSEALNTQKAVFTDAAYDESEFAFADYRGSRYQALINISIGCDKQCAYCIVPHARGKEISIPSRLILNEARRAAESGAVEIVLLGQNVNSYGARFSGENETIDFSSLLERVAEIDGIRRIRFQSPHPLHIDERFLEVFARIDKVCKHLHLPLQSGSNRVLRAMKRGYTRERFLEIANRAREVPKSTISTDIIVGFPGETDEDFEETLEVMRVARFEQVFAFRFSPRPMTAAAKMENQVEPEIAAARLAILQNLYKSHLKEAARSQIGKVFECFLEAASGGEGLYARAHNFFALKVACDQATIRDRAGSFAPIKAIAANNGALIGEFA